MIQLYNGDNDTWRFCWHGGAFFEFVLGDGTVIITDPYQYGSKRGYVKDNTKYASEIITGCDYVLLSHTHFDHAQDLPAIVNRFPDSILIVPDDAYVSLMMRQGHNPFLSRIQPVGHQDRLEFEEFRLDTYRGKHTVLSVNDPVMKGHEEDFVQGVPYMEQEKYRAEEGTFDTVKGMFDVEAAMAFRNYQLTLPTGESILIWGGEFDHDYRRFLYKDMKPDLMLLQLAATNVGGDRNHPKIDRLVDFMRLVNPKHVIPQHQENFSWDILENISLMCNRMLNNEKSEISYFNLSPSKWYMVK
ncbi:MAG: MBL fold metallo-hydrolase [Hungatella sp.]|nr:MBL fold metallo-hydrolase [Hungatella sp.]